MINTTAIGVEHLQDGLFPDALYTGNGLSVSPHTFYSSPADAGMSAMGLFKRGTRTIYGALAQDFVNKRGMAGFQFLTLVGDRQDTQSLAVGFRVVAANTPATSGRSAFGLCSVQPSTANYTGPETTLLNYTGTYLAPGYYEFEFVAYRSDGVGPLCSVYLDGSFLRSTPNMGSGNMWLPVNLPYRWFSFGDNRGNMFASNVPGQGAAGDSLIEFEDFYVSISNVKGVPARRGPALLRRLDVGLISAPDWASSDGTKTPVEVLNLPQHHGPVLTPVVSSDVGNSPGRVKFDLSQVYENDKILAVTGAASVRRAVGVSSSMGAKWSANSQDGATVSATPTNGAWTLQKDILLPTLSTLPDGTALTKASLANLELVLTPNP